MPITESRLRDGVLTLDATDFAAQATSVELNPKTDEAGDPLETLSGDTITAEDETSWSLDIEAVQDFTDPAGFVRFSHQRAGEIVTYSWTPNVDGPTYTGTVRVRPVTIGGDVNKRLTTGASWPCQQAPTETYPPVG